MHVRFLPDLPFTATFSDVPDRFYPSHARSSFLRRISLGAQKVRPHTPTGVTLRAVRKMTLIKYPPIMLPALHPVAA